MIDFHCGHVTAEANGGVTSIENLRPICKACNLSMRTENMEEFKKRCTFGIVEKKIPKKKKINKVEEKISTFIENDETVLWEPGMIKEIRPKFFWIPMKKDGPFDRINKEKYDAMKIELKGLYIEVPNSMYMTSIYGTHKFRRITSKNAKETDEVLEWYPDILYNTKPKHLIIPEFKEPTYIRMMFEIQGLYIRDNDFQKGDYYKRI
jgi:hypothetical protein